MDLVGEVVTTMAAWSDACCLLSVKAEKQEGDGDLLPSAGRQITVDHQFALRLIGTDEKSGISPSTKVGWVKTASRSFV